MYRATFVCLFRVHRLEKGDLKSMDQVGPFLRRQRVSFGQTSTDPYIGTIGWTHNSHGKIMVRVSFHCASDHKDFGEADKTFRAYTHCAAAYLTPQIG